MYIRFTYIAYNFVLIVVKQFHISAQNQMLASIFSEISTDEGEGDFFQLPTACKV